MIHVFVHVPLESLRAGARYTCPQLAAPQLYGDRVFNMTTTPCNPSSE